jgi:hypothetical protein
MSRAAPVTKTAIALAPKPAEWGGNIGQLHFPDFGSKIA